MVQTPQRAKKRRTKDEVDQVRRAIIDTLEQERPMTVRQVFYQLVSQGVIAKSEKEYKNTVVRLLTDMRRDGSIPFNWIADNTRWMRKAITYDSLQDALYTTAMTYRRSLWQESDAYVEIWLEKDALAGVLFQVTEEWDVPLMVTRGYPSVSFLHSAAEDIKSQSEFGRTTYLYYFGDYDPSGVDIPRFVERQLREFAPEARMLFECIAVTPEQIRQLNLPTRPTKRTDSRAKNFDDSVSVEVDAIPPRVLRSMVQDCITNHLDEYELSQIRKTEEWERETLQAISSKWSAPISYEEG